jgi:acylphosphatase
MTASDLAGRVLAAVQGDDDAIKKLSEALVSGDPAEIKRVCAEVAKIEISDAEAQEIVRDLGADPQKAVGYAT